MSTQQFNFEAYEKNLETTLNYAENRLKFMESIFPIQASVFKTFLWIASILLSSQIFFLTKYHWNIPIANLFLLISLIVVIVLFLLCLTNMFKPELPLRMPKDFSKLAYKYSDEQESPRDFFLNLFIDSINKSILSFEKSILKTRKDIRTIKWMAAIAIIIQVIGMALTRQ